MSERLAVAVADCTSCRKLRRLTQHRNRAAYSGLMRMLTVAIAAVLLSSFAPAAAQAAGCEFVLGFAQLATAIPAVVGQCTEAQYYVIDSGVTYGAQHTTTGTMVWDKSSDWTYFYTAITPWHDQPEVMPSSATQYSLGPDGVVSVVRYPLSQAAATQVPPTPTLAQQQAACEAKGWIWNPFSFEKCDAPEPPSYSCSFTGRTDMDCRPY